MKTPSLFLGLLAIASFSGCTAYPTITSNPPGASVQLNGQPLGVTPFKTSVRDIWGKRSVYSFTAAKQGYKTKTITYQESGLADASSTIPGNINFDLK